MYNFFRKEDVVMTNGEKIKKLRENLGESVMRFADKLFVDVSTVAHWEDGTIEPTEDDLRKISSTYSVGSDYFDYSMFKKEEKVVKEEPIDPKLAKEIADKDRLNRGDHLANCAKCGKPIYTNDTYHFFPSHESNAKLHHHYDAYYLCKNCYEEDLKLQKAEEEEKTQHENNVFISRFIIGAIIVIIIIILAVMSNVK